MNTERDNLRMKMPYLIEFNKKTLDYYLIDRNYEYIGFNKCKLLKDIENDIDINEKDYGWKRINLYDDTCKPWAKKEYMTKYEKKMKLEKGKLKDCKSVV